MRDEHFDVVIVGSGFGGAVSAYRLADAGLRVCVLERGKAYPPQAFARDPHGFHGNLWDPSEGLHGLFDIWSFRRLEAVVSSGLGGGSLIYANVMLRKDPASFVRDDPHRTRWPISYADLEDHYKAVETMLGAKEYPLADTTPKTKALRQAARDLGLQWQNAKLAVTFSNGSGAPTLGGPIYSGSYPNYHGAPRFTCRLCGECDIGCPYGSKNTLDHTYLSAAKHKGADIRPRCEVRRFEPVSLRDGGGYAVHYVDHQGATEGEPRDTRSLPERTLTCTQLVLASGALGSTYLLLKNRAQFRRLSPTLGSNFSGNGDVLGFARECHDKRNGGRPYPVDPSNGPVITGMIHVPDAQAGGRGFYIQDGGYPVFAQWLLQMTQVSQLLLRSLRFGARYLAGLIGFNTDSNLSAELSALIGQNLLASTSLTMLGIGRDVADGRMYLSRSPFRSRYSHLQIAWTPDTSRAYFAAVHETMDRISTELGGRFRPNILSHLQRLITVHPLGGCPMGDGREDGVVDQHGEVFEYPGLFVVDGAAMPAAVGANPSLTIAAYAHRCADRVITVHRRRHPAHPHHPLQAAS